MTSSPARPSIQPSPRDNDPVDRMRMSFGDHLDELRARLLWGLIGTAVGMAIALMFGKGILSILLLPLQVVQFRNGIAPSLQVLAPTGAFVTYLKISFLSGLILSMPWLLYQLWRFVASGLYDREQRFVRLLVPTSLGLFFVGVLFLYFVVLPIMLHFFICFNADFDIPDLAPTAIQRWLIPTKEKEPLPVHRPPASGPLRIPVVDHDPDDAQEGNLWYNETTRRLMLRTRSGVSSTPLAPGAKPTSMQSQFALDFYVSFVLMLALAFGIAFETPIMVLFLAWSGIVARKSMARSRRYVILGVLMACAILTPPDVVSQILLAGPMYLLFEAGLIVARLVEKRSPRPGGS